MNFFQLWTQETNFFDLLELAAKILIAYRWNLLFLQLPFQILSATPLCYFVTNLSFTTFVKMNIFKRFKRAHLKLIWFKRIHCKQSDMTQFNFNNLSQYKLYTVYAADVLMYLSVATTLQARSNTVSFQLLTWLKYGVKFR